MIQKTQLSTYVENAPGVLAGLCGVLADNDINIEAMSIQNARDYVLEMFKARERTGRRIAPAQNYASIMQDAADYSVIRMIVDDEERARELLDAAEYVFDASAVLVIPLENRPGTLGRIAAGLAEAEINIDYVYGSVTKRSEESLFIIHVADVEAALLKLQNQKDM